MTQHISLPPIRIRYDLHRLPDDTRLAECPYLADLIRIARAMHGLEEDAEVTVEATDTGCVLRTETGEYIGKVRIVDRVRY